MTPVCKLEIILAPKETEDVTISVYRLDYILAPALVRLVIIQTLESQIDALVCENNY